MANADQRPFRRDLFRTAPRIVASHRRATRHPDSPAMRMAQASKDGPGTVAGEGSSATQGAQTGLERDAGCPTGLGKLFAHRSGRDCLRTFSINRNPSDHGAKETGVGIVFGRTGAGPWHPEECNGPHTIRQVSAEGTAFQSGLVHAGDTLLKVDGVEVGNLTTEQVSALIFGKPSSQITLTIAQSPATPSYSPAIESTMTYQDLQGTPASEQLHAHDVFGDPETLRSDHREVLSVQPWSGDRGHEKSFALQARKDLLPPVPDFSKNELDHFGSGVHETIPNLQFEQSGHAGIEIGSSRKVAHNLSGSYLTCLRMTPAIPPTGKHHARFEIIRQGPDGTARRHSRGKWGRVHEGCGSFIGVCDSQWHPSGRRAMGSEHAWMVSLRTGTRFHNNRDLPPPHAAPAQQGSIVAVMVDMDKRFARIQVDSHAPGALFAIPQLNGGLLCIAIDLCRGDAIEILT